RPAGHTAPKLPVCIRSAWRRCLSFPESGFLSRKKCYGPAHLLAQSQWHSVLLEFSPFLKEYGYRCPVQHFQSSLRFVSRWKGTQIELKHSYYILLAKPAAPV